MRICNQEFNSYARKLEDEKICHRINEESSIEELDSLAGTAENC
jgi:hypothetical protein